MQGSCAKGETCCEGLKCCAGVPIPEGMEFCANMCPISDRNLKADFRSIDPAVVLAKVVAMPITTWRYKKDSTDVRHLGPMAQDFAAAFGLGKTERLIFPLDATGVSMAAIQGMHQRLVDAEEENAALHRQLADLERRMIRLEAGQKP
ncbi:MAG TPA: tail fiber domain-containing protein [Nannocystis exedens]|nr:tail fiber domain-containing protein [Nannocystis exedens]